MRIPIILFLLLGVLSQVLGQDAFPSSISSPIWHLQSWEDGQMDTSYYSIRSTSSVVACNKEWSIAQIFTAQNIILDTIGYYYVEDTRVFFTDSLNCAETPILLYEFDLSQGDSAYFPLYPTQDNPDTTLFKVIFKNSNEFEGEQRAQFLMRYWFDIDGIEQSDNTVWINGIGDTRHPFYNSLCLFKNYCTRFQVTCVESSNNLIYQTPGRNTCGPQVPLNRIYVNANHYGGQHTGENWTNAITNLQDAIAIAGAGDTLWVAQGRYFPTKGNLRSKSFRIKDSLVIYGGFQGTEVLLDERNPSIFPSILSGNINNPLDSTDNCFHVLTNHAINFSTLDGFQVELGHSNINSNNVFENSGAGIFLMPSSKLKIENCTFSKNIAKNGGAIYVADNAQITLLNSLFLENSATVYGGGIFKDFQTALDTTNVQIIQGCQFEKNYSFQEGTAIHISELVGSLDIKECIFNNQQSAVGGTIYLGAVTRTDSIIIEDCVFSNNQVNNGAGLYIPYVENSSSPNSYTIQIINSDFINNRTFTLGGSCLFANSTLLNRINLYVEKSRFINNTGTVSGAIELLNNFIVDVSISNCIFDENQTDIGAAAAIRISPDQSSNQLYNKLDIFNTVFKNNDGAILNLGGLGNAQTNIINCTFFKNGTSPMIKSPGFQNGIPTNLCNIRNSVFWEPGISTGLIFFNNDFQSQNLFGFNIDHSLLSSFSCNVTGGEEACGEHIIFDTDPLFENPEESLVLLPCSPAINRGNNTYIEDYDLPEDLIGNPRILNDTVDIGAYEIARFMLEGDFSIQDATTDAPSGGSIQVNDVSGGIPPYAYAWSNGDMEPSIDGLQPGEYTLTVTDQTGCSQNWSFIIDLINGVEDQHTAQQLALNPNPARDEVQIEWLGPRKASYQLRLFNSLGEQLAVFPFSGRGSFDVSMLAPGIYYCQLWDGQEKLAGRRLVVGR
jgi:parallel beta-helix repeat protein